jgi:hypothetical protein
LIAFARKHRRVRCSRSPEMKAGEVAEIRSSRSPKLTLAVACPKASAVVPRISGRKGQRCGNERRRTSERPAVRIQPERTNRGRIAPPIGESRLEVAGSSHTD